MKEQQKGTGADPNAFPTSGGGGGGAVGSNLMAEDERDPDVIPAQFGKIQREPLRRYLRLKF